MRARGGETPLLGVEHRLEALLVGDYGAVRDQCTLGDGKRELLALLSRGVGDHDVFTDLDVVLDYNPKDDRAVSDGDSAAHMQRAVEDYLVGGGEIIADLYVRRFEGVEGHPIVEVGVCPYDYRGPSSARIAVLWPTPGHWARVGNPRRS